MGLRGNALLVGRCYDMYIVEGSRVCDDLIRELASLFELLECRIIVTLDSVFDRREALLGGLFQL